MISIKEENLSPDAKAVLDIVRAEAQEGRLTEKQQQFLDRAIVLHDALGIVGKFVVWFAGLLIAISTCWAYVGPAVRRTLGLGG